MTDRIDAILFDMGGTLRRSVKRDAAAQSERLQQILEILGAEMDAVEFARLLTERAASYARWADETLGAVEEAELWTRWMLPDWPAGQVRENALLFNRIWRDALSVKTLLPEAKELILSLFRSGYRLGLVSNTLSSEEAPAALESLGIAGCFDVVVLSCLVGIRKPDPAILLNATSRMGVDPARCAYVGNNAERDVVSSRGAGFSKVVLVKDPRKPFDLAGKPHLVPDHQIENLLELLDIFPSRRGHKEPVSKGGLYDASLSTMWGIGKFSELSDFLLAAPRLGFARVELNHQVNPAMLAGVDLEGSRISSIHEPCPAVIPANELKKADLLISSVDEERRRQGVDAIKRSLDLARELDIRAIVVHCGQIQADWSIEKEMFALFEKGQAGSPEYLKLKDAFVKLRAERVGPCLEAVRKSLAELLEHAEGSNVCLGIENRYHYFDIPALDEMGGILDLAGPDRIGFVYDVGHAQVQDRLGFYPHEAWLKQFAPRIIGTHIHDVIGITDHRAPGLGEVDFRMVAAYLPPEAFRTIEVKSINSPEQIRTGMKILADTGCVSFIQ